MSDTSQKNVNYFYSVTIGFINLVRALLFFIIQLIWNSFITIIAVCLTIAWICFLFGSVLGVVLLLIFMGVKGFFLPMSMLNSLLLDKD